MICMDGSVLCALKLAFGLYHYPADTTQACVFLLVIENFLLRPNVLQGNETTLPVTLCARVLRQLVTTQPVIASAPQRSNLPLNG